MGGALCICGWSGLVSAFVQCCRGYVHEPVFVMVDLVSSCDTPSPSVTRDSCHPTQGLP
jgi:hypothetical protein